ncbi:MULTISPECIES: hypothetical protein [Caballeronia]|uniref:hypothetical protein n=1 Tax=Caballeronia TaxID=1827195 RepID=UPI000F74914D|nr:MULTISPECIES: hypothetical protein [Caballeronia]
MMIRAYEYKGFTLEVAVQSNFTSVPKNERTTVAYVVIVKIGRTGGTVATFSPLRLGDTGGRLFATEGDALMAGYSAARHIVEDLLSADPEAKYFDPL